MMLPRRLIALAFLLACANTAIAADDTKMGSGTAGIAKGRRNYCPFG
jgi:hypothetical protein